MVEDDLVLDEVGQGVVVADLQLRPLGPEVFLVLPLREVGAVLHDELCVMLLEALAPLDLIVDGGPAAAQHFGDLIRLGSGFKRPFHLEAILPAQVLVFLSLCH